MTQPFKCPSCGGPLEYDGGDIRLRCPYCTNSVIVPEELRPYSATNAAPLVWHEQIAKLAHIGQLIRGGNKIAAIKLYRETFGSGLKEAKDAVENLAAGRPVEVSRTIGMGGNLQLDPRQVPNWPSPESLVATRAQGCSTLFWLVGIICLIAIVGIGAAVYSAIYSGATTTVPPSLPSSKTPTKPKAAGKATATPPGFASLSLQFGSEGIGAGQFKDSRSVAVDGQGHIYTGEYTGGRVQVFDRDGKFITQWMVDPKMPLLRLAADRQGTVYVVQKADITRYEGMTGKLLGKVQRAAGNGFYEDVFVTLDGGLVAVDHGEDIVRLNAAGQIVRTIKAAISEQSGDSELDTHVAEDGQGNIYALGTFNNAVFKFGPNGKYITRFGGAGDQPGQLRAPESVAVDGQGRVYVSDIKGIQVFDENGRYLDLFKLESVPFGMVFNDKNELFVAGRTMVYKFAVNK